MHVRPKSAITRPPNGREPVPRAVPKPAIRPAGASRDVGMRSGTGSALGVAAVTPLDHLAQLAEVITTGAAADTYGDLTDASVSEAVGVLLNPIEGTPDAL